MKTLWFGVVCSSLLSATSLFAQKPAIEGDVADTKGRVVKNAEVWIQQETGNGAPLVLKTDAKGHFVASGLPVGSYKIAVAINGAAKVSAAHVKTQSGCTVNVKLLRKRNGRGRSRPSLEKEGDLGSSANR